MSFDNNQTFWKEFMVLYREKPCLWDIKSKEYRNKSLKNVAYSSLIKKSKELFPEANKDFVTKKISSFRSSFRRQVRRIENAKRGGATEEVPEITLWYFDLLLFLLDEEERTKIMSYVKGTNYDEKIEGTAIQTRASRKRYQNIEISAKILQEKRCMKGKEETTFIRNVGQQLAELASKQKVIAQKLISDVLSNAKLGNLNKFSTIFINPGSPSSTTTTVTTSSTSVHQSSQ